MKETDYTTISIKKELAEKVKKNFIKNSGFKNLNDFTTFLFRDLLCITNKEERKLKQKDIENIKEKLKILGYI